MDDKRNAIPMLDLKAQYLPIKEEVTEAIQRVIEGQHFINGPEVAALEEDVARYSGVKHCIGVSSGSDALLVALMALDIGPGAEVITTPYTFFATVGAIVRLGATPVFVDIDPQTYNLDVSALESRLSPRTRAIMPVHLFGQCADMGPLLDVARRQRLHVIEDAAQALGSEYQGKRAGSLGTVGCYSFFPSKNLGAFGDGGAVVTNDAVLAEKMRCLRGHGSNPKYFHKLVGGNFRLDTLHAAVLRVKLHYLDSWTANRQRNAAHYDVALARTGLVGKTLDLPRVAQSRHIFNQYVLRVQERDALRECLQQQRIATEIYYPRPMHLQECFANLGHRAGDYPESERASATTVALPMFPELTQVQQDRVVQGIADFYATQQQRRRQAA